METFGRAIRSMSLMAPMFLWCSGNPVTPTLKVTERFAHFWISFKAFSFEMGRCMTGRVSALQQGSRREWQKSGTAKHGPLHAALSAEQGQQNSCPLADGARHCPPECQNFRQWLFAPTLRGYNGKYGCSRASAQSRCKPRRP